MRRCAIISLGTASLALLVGARDGGGRRGRRRLGTSRYESVSAEPLTFEAAEPEPVSRERILAEADINGAEFDFMEDMAHEDMYLANLEGGHDDQDESSEDFDFLGEDFEEYDDMEEDIVNENAYDYEQPTQGGEEGTFADSTYVSEDGVNFVSQEDERVEEAAAEHVQGEEGTEYVGESMVYGEPIARRLRRVGAPVVEERPIEDELDQLDEERYLKEKMSFRDDSIPEVSL